MKQRFSPQALFSAVRRRWPLLILALVFFLALAIRTIDLTSNPRGFFADEASFGVNADLILHSGKDEHGEFLPILFRSFGEYKLPAFIYAEVPFVAILGRSELAVRLTAAVLGSLTVITTYLLAKEIFRREAPALFAAALLAILPWHIHYSRSGLGDIVVLPLMLSLSLFLFLRAMRKESSIIPAVLAFGVTFYCYRAAWVILPPLMLLLAALHYKELLAQRANWLASCAILFVFGFPLLRHLFSETGDRSGEVSIFKRHAEEGTLHLFWRFYKSYFSTSFLFEKGDNQEVLRHYLPGHGELYWFLAPFIMLGVIALLSRMDRRAIIVLGLLILFPLSGAVSDHSPISSRTIVGSLAFVLVSAAGLGLVLEAFEHFPPRVARASALALGAVVVVVAGVSFGSYYTRYMDDYPRLSAGYWGWQDGAGEIVHRFLEVQDSYDELYLDGEFNAPQIFIPFYAGKACKKCTVGGLDRYNPTKRQLFAVKPKNLKPDEFTYVDRGSLYYPGGEQSFIFVEVQKRSPQLPIRP